MVDPDFLDKLDKIGQIVRNSEAPFGGIQIILCGDFMQLPPVSRDAVRRFAFESKVWGKLLNGAESCVKLSKVYRQRDDRLVKILQEIRTGRLGEESCRLLKGTQSNNLGDNAPM
jgi:ATP-dependent DNA helicase PIF1